MLDRLTRAVIEALVRAPCSVNAVARAADVPQSTLSRILSGKRDATPAVAAAVRQALERWGRECEAAAGAIRQARRKGRTE